MVIERDICRAVLDKLSRHTNFIGRLVSRGYSPERIARHYNVPLEIARDFIARTSGPGPVSPPWETPAA